MPLANNTVFQRVSNVRTFFKWCLRNGFIDANPAEHLRDRDCPLNTFKRTAGKLQAKFPGRWLTKDEAFGVLVAHHMDGSEVGMRNELLLRFGLLGLRAHELAALRWANVSELPTVQWMGKGSKPRKMTAGPVLIKSIAVYRASYEAAIGRPVAYDDPLLCRGRSGPRNRYERRLLWGTGIAKDSVFRLVTDAARSAGIGHLAPHDLRRTTAAILHRDTTDDGGHKFDLLDIQKVLGHSDPATTMKSYLDPIDTEVLDRAGGCLD